MLFRHTLTWRDVGFRERLTVIASIAGSTATVDLMRLLSNAALTTASDGPTVATGGLLRPKQPILTYRTRGLSLAKIQVPIRRNSISLPRW
jgi:hypothetical protein